MAGFNSVSDLKHFKTMWRVRVSIVRLWKQYSAAGGLTIEMVLIDSNGDKIHASAKKNCFLSPTRVRISEDLPGAPNGFTPVNFREVLDGTLNPNFLIGEDVRLPTVLWGKFASDVTNAIQLRSEERVILVLRFGKIKVWKEQRSVVSNAYNVSDVQLNPMMA
ncbi:hypothetical protein DY000_02048572 [Brassica cretica]|uniref:Replication protein A 70 kDa DNA-binding subunit B/D first OB fold domain-containing protein n=1 Tax=Brassica cretica TaxID=69181 RepID=A0ABQ7F436_BRACR|nr:hypothetical protein DY000_02048572 [Brassica cretica]